MKKILFTIAAALMFLAAKAQQPDTANRSTADTSIYTDVQQLPTFPGGMAKFYYFLSRVIRYPANSRENNIQGKVTIAMVVEKNGSLSHLKVAQHLADDIDKEALRVMALCPKWNPGMQNGKAVRTAFSVPISFTLAQ
jgi:protein TonB